MDVWPIVVISDCFVWDREAQDSLSGSFWIKWYFAAIFFEGRGLLLDINSEFPAWAAWVFHFTSFFWCILVDRTVGFRFWYPERARALRCLHHIFHPIAIPTVRPHPHPPHPHHPIGRCLPLHCCNPCNIILCDDRIPGAVAFGQWCWGA